MTEHCLRQASGGSTLAVRLRPRSSRRGVDGIRDGALEVRVTAPPVEGKANAAARELLAGILGLPRRQIRLAVGERSRKKVFFIEGLSPGEIRLRLEGSIKKA